MTTKQNDVVSEYLREVDQRLAGIPVLQRRELLADLEAHIAAERAERNVSGEGELIEILERLGSPEVVAAAAHEEAGTRPKPPAPRRRAWPWVALAAGIVIMFFLCFALFFAQSSSEPQISEQPRPVEPMPTVQIS